MNIYLRLVILLAMVVGLTYIIHTLVQSINESVRIKDISQDLEEDCEFKPYRLVLGFIMITIISTALYLMYVGMVTTH